MQKPELDIDRMTSNALRARLGTELMSASHLISQQGGSPELRAAVMRARLIWIELGRRGDQGTFFAD
jgi:hypothetical protein